MSRRSTSEKIDWVVIDSVGAGSGLVAVIAPDSNTALAPKSVVVSSHGGGAIEYEFSTNGEVFLHGHVPADDSAEISFPDGLEMPLGSGIEFEVTGSDGSVTLYYVPYDSTPPITKEAARLATYIPSNATATRTPNLFGDQAQT